MLMLIKKMLKMAMMPKIVFEQVILTMINADGKFRTRLRQYRDTSRERFLFGAFDVHFYIGGRGISQDCVQGDPLDLR